MKSVRFHGVNKTGGRAEGAWRSSDTPEGVLKAVYFSSITDSQAFRLQRFTSVRAHSQILEHMEKQKVKNSRKINIIAMF